jgi:glycerol uptake facilitator protein
VAVQAVGLHVVGGYVPDAARFDAARLPAVYGGRGGTMEEALTRRLAAEVVGTAILVLFGAGSVVAALRLGGGELEYAGLGMVAIAFALAIAVAIYAFGTTSGAHINPAVTVSLAAVGRFPWQEVPAYVGAQLVGGAAGAALIVAAFGGEAVDLGTGGTTLADEITYTQGIVAEALATFLLLTAIMALAVDRRAPPGWAGLMIGLAVAAAILVTGPLTGGSLNPARTFGPMLITGIGGGDASWGDLPAYIIGPLLGGVIAAFAYDAIARPRAIEAEPAQGALGDIEGRRDRAVERPASPVAPAGPAPQGTRGDITGRRE